MALLRVWKSMNTLIKPSGHSWWQASTTKKYHTVQGLRFEMKSFSKCCRKLARSSGRVSVGAPAVRHHRHHQLGAALLHHLAAEDQGLLPGHRRVQANVELPACRYSKSVMRRTL